jgi:hypothetical protein
MTKASPPVSKTPRQSKAWIKRAGKDGQPVQSHVAGLSVASAGFQRPGSFFVHTLPLPRDHDVNTSAALHISNFTVTKHHSHSATTAYCIHEHTLPPAIRGSRNALFSYHTPARQQLTSGRLHRALPSFLPSKPVPIRASARHTNPPPRIHLTATHNTLRQQACSLYVTA